MNKRPKPPLNYTEYLQIDSLLKLQRPVGNIPRPHHDETLFIIVHQAFELWFKQLHHELDWILNLFKGPVSEDQMGQVVAHLRRMTEIIKLFPAHFNILETMTPMDFLEFRDDLSGASGFQSIQFKQLEIKLGLPLEGRRGEYMAFLQHALSKKEINQLQQLAARPSLLQLLQNWLERTPFLDFKDYHFWQYYSEAIKKRIEREEQQIEGDCFSSASFKQKQREGLDKTKKHFECLMDRKIHQQLIAEGERTLSHQASLAFLFICLHRHQPALQWPTELLMSCIDFDEHFTNFRHRHALLAHRMLGRKVGTGGSSGFEFLQRSAIEHRVFVDFFDLMSFLLPKSVLSPLPKELTRALNFYFTQG